MKGRVIALGMMREREAAALVEDGRLIDFVIAAPDPEQPQVGAIYRGHAGRPMKGLGGIFVELGNDTRGFLRSAKGTVPGQPLIVQVHSNAEPGKAPPVTTRLMLRGRTVHVTPGVPGVNVARVIKDEAQRGELKILAEDVLGKPAGELGVIVRTAAGSASEDEIAEELTSLKTLAQKLSADVTGPPELLLDAATPHQYAWREWDFGDADDVLRGENAFAEANVEDELDALFQPLVGLSAQASMTIEPTHALVAVDVNTGGSAGSQAGLAANISAAEALPRALRLRGLGGQITVDFAPCPKGDRKRIEQVLTRAFRKDGIETTLAGWTPLGHFELNRKRERVPL